MRDFFFFLSFMYCCGSLLTTGMRRKSALELRRKKTTCCNFGGSNEKPETCPLEFHHRGAVSLCCALKSIGLYAQSNPPSILTDSRQLIVLVTPHWNAVNGTLRR